MVPEKLGPYRIERRIGRGGMGTVYYGIHGETGFEAAIKVLNSGMSAEEGFRARFISEIETLKKLAHPNIVRLYGFGEQGDLLFYAMEFVEGRNLQDELAAGRRFQWREVTRIAIDVCRAMKHAHDCGVVHRDLKPANLMLDKDEQIKLTDFGIARLFGVTNLTITGGVMGTADYMSPEQAQGQSVDTRSDLYSLGCVLYALLAGRPPFTAESIAEVLDKLRFADPVPVGKRAEDVPQEFERIIGQLLEKEPQHRIPTAVALTKRLEAMLHALSVRPETDEIVGAGRPIGDEQDFVVGDPPADTDEHVPAVPAIATNETVSAAAKADAIENAPGESVPAESPAAGADETQDAAAPAANGKTSPNRFTTVAEERMRRRPATVWSQPLHWLTLAGLAAMLGLIAWLVFAALQPPSADQLFSRIAAAGEDGEPESLLAVENQINSFRSRFPDDPRCREVRTWQQEIELYRLERRLERQPRRRGQDLALTAVERAYLEATLNASTRPEEAVVKLQAMIDVFDFAESDDSRARQCVELARRQLRRLQREIDAWREEHLQAILAQLDRADSLNGSDPSAARAVRRGVVELYAGKSWAATAVERARQGLPSSENPPE